MEHPIRILRRPDQPLVNTLNVPHRQPSKTLEERKADYAAARKRIMESSSPEPGSVVVDENTSLDDTLEGHLTNTVSVVTNIPTADLGNLKGNLNNDVNYKRGLPISSGFYNNDDRRLLNVDCTLKLSANENNQSHNQILATPVSFTNNLNSNSNLLAPFISFQNNYNSGLLPSTDMYCSYPNVSNNPGNSQLQVINLIQHLNYLQQQYQQLFSGTQNRLTIFGRNSSESFNCFNLQHSLSRPIYLKSVFPPTFN